jgi:hypothetical protein
MKPKQVFRLILLLSVISMAGVAFGAPAAAPGVETNQIQSKLLGATLSYNVVLPPDYPTSPATRYPVIYLLPGLTGHYSDWITRTNVADYAAKYRMIVVVPEGNNGWYTDSATKPTDKYESYIIRELLPDVQKRYRTIETRYGRAIAGLSMAYWDQQVQEILKIAAQKLRFPPVLPTEPMRKPGSQRKAGKVKPTAFIHPRWRAPLLPENLAQLIFPIYSLDTPRSL